MRPVAGVQLPLGQHASATTREMLARPPPTSPKALIIASTSGLPLVSTTIRSRIRRSSRDGVTESNNARASETGSPVTSSSGKPSSSWPGCRAPNTGATDSTSNRRPTNPSTCAEARSSHCASSTRHSSGRSPETSDSRLKTASPTRKRSGGATARIPNTVLQRLALRLGEMREADWGALGETFYRPLSCPAAPRNPAGETPSGGEQRARRGTHRRSTSGDRAGEPDRQRGQVEHRRATPDPSIGPRMSRGMARI